MIASCAMVNQHGVIAGAGFMSGGYRADDHSLEEPGRSSLAHANWEVPGSAKVPGIALAVAMSFVWLGHVRSGGMLNWGISASALRGGRWETVLLHMFAHAGPMHILLNTLALVPLAGLLTARLGKAPSSWGRLLLLYLLGGMCGAAFYLAVHPGGVVPMLGASGAICAVVGLLLRLPDDGYELHPLRSERIQLAAKEFAKENFILILILTVPALLSGRGGGVAWEAHLGGLLFGLFLGPKLLPTSFRSTSFAAAA